VFLNNDELNDFDRELLSSNIIGAKTIKELAIKERQIVSLKEFSLRKKGINGNFDYAHLKAIHRELFEDIYVWAGKDRYDIGSYGVFRKGGTEFTYGKKLPEIAKDLFTALKDENYFKALKKEEMIKSLASFLNGINILHPFREGNGRTQRLFLEELAKNAKYELNLSNVSQNIMIQASIQGAKGNIKGYEIILREYLK
jgi:cell filamentation protein